MEKSRIDKAVTWTFRKVQESDVYLVFHRYMEYSIKDNTRNTRQKGLTMPLPPQKVLLTVTQNKIQLIDLIVAAPEREGSVQTMWTQTSSNWT